jgi:hypothetical protein
MTNVYALYPGSWNPLHSQHLEIAHDVKEYLGINVTFEICRTVYDKSNLSDEEVARRKAQFDMIYRKSIVTNNTSFVQKVISDNQYALADGYDCGLFPVGTKKYFIAGYDTVARVDDKKYYFGSEAERDRCLDIIYVCGWKILVYPRGGKLKDNLSDRMLKLCEFREDFVETNISSTQLRQVNSKENYVPLSEIEIYKWFEYKGNIYQRCGYSLNDGFIIVSIQGKEFIEFSCDIAVIKRESWSK